MKKVILSLKKCLMFILFIVHAFLFGGGYIYTGVCNENDIPIYIYLYITYIGKSCWNEQ